MKLKRGIQLITAAILLIGVAAYIVYAICWAAEERDPEAICTSVELNIEQNQHSGFITPATIEQTLRTANIYPAGRNLADISTRAIEAELQKNDFVEDVTCYKTANRKVHIDITQRTPVIYILKADGNGYYVDRNGKIIQKTAYPVNMPVATGKITQRYAQKCLSRLGNYIVGNDFWNNQIEQLYVSTNSDGEYTIDIIPRIGTGIIKLGTIANYEKKLSRLRTFYEKAVPTIGWNKYTTIDLAYDGQIICKKQKKK